MPPEGLTDKDLDDWWADRFSAAEYETALRDLVGNAMRIARGSGKPYEITRQVVWCLAAFRNYRAQHGMEPSAQQIAAALYALDAYDHESGHRPNRDLEEVVSGALQIAASRLLRQPHQESLGRSAVVRAAREGDLIDP